MAAKDAHLLGFLEGWLLAAHGLGPSQVTVAVENGKVMLTGGVSSVEEADLISSEVLTFEGVAEVINRLEIMPEAASAETGPDEETRGREEERRQRWESWTDWFLPEGRRMVRFPVGHLFTPPLADQKQPRFHTTWQRYDLAIGVFNVASVGFGADFGLLRLPASRAGDGWQLGISGAVFSIFNLDAPSNDLINSDFIVGIPLAWRHRHWSARARVYHQSSHLGDEFLLYPQPVTSIERINLSYEALELLLSHEWRGLRIYTGPTRIVRSFTSLKRDILQWGVEYRGAPFDWRTARFIAGADMRIWEETDWDLDLSLKTGIRFRSPYADAHSVELLVEYYDGHIPHGQFYEQTVRFFGLGIAYGF